MKQNEHDITKAIRSMLNCLGVFHWKAWQGPMSQPRGVADILGCWEGRMLAIEVKRPGGKVTDDQEKFLKKVAENGGIAFVARSVDDVISGLGAEKMFITQSKTGSVSAEYSLRTGRIDDLTSTHTQPRR